MRLYLIRHGQTTSNVGHHLDTAEPGASLTDLGREQAAALPGLLGGAGLGALYASTLVRTQQTAAPLARALGLEVRVRDGIREVPAGDLEMKNDDGSIRSYLNTILGWAAGATDPMPGTRHTGADILGRFDEVVEEAFRDVDRLAGPAVGFVSHGAVLRAWTASRCVNVATEFAAQTPVTNTGIIVVNGEPGRWRAERWLDHDLGGPETEDGAAAETVDPDAVPSPDRA